MELDADASAQMALLDAQRTAAQVELIDVRRRLAVTVDALRWLAAHTAVFTVENADEKRGTVVRALDGDDAEVPTEFFSIISDAVNYTPAARAGHDDSMVAALSAWGNRHRAELFARWPDQWLVITTVGVLAAFPAELDAIEWAYQHETPGEFCVWHATETERVYLVPWNQMPREPVEFDPEF